MALESAQYISQLVQANPLSTDTVAQAGDHMRLIKKALKNTFPNLDGPVTITPTQMNYPIPQGAIILWSGDAASIPLGYAVCNGASGTPDLRSRFVMGGGGAAGYVLPPTTGGAATTGAAGTHTHTANSATAALSTTTATVAAGTGAGTDVSVITSVSANGHTHTVNAVGDHTHSSLPPFMALYYIMKL